METLGKIYLKVETGFFICLSALNKIYHNYWFGLQKKLIFLTTRPKAHLGFEVHEKLKTKPIHTAIIQGIWVQKFYFFHRAENI
jgi:hypothetical protein